MWVRGIKKNGGQLLLNMDTVAAVEKVGDGGYLSFYLNTGKLLGTVETVTIECYEKLIPANIILHLGLSDPSEGL